MVYVITALVFRLVERAEGTQILSRVVQSLCDTDTNPSTPRSRFMG